MSKCVSELCEDQEDIIQEAFQNQLCEKIDNKLREFSFKVMHQILPCNANLAKWRLRASDRCDMCIDRQHTIEHLLFSCSQAVHIWNIVNNTYHVNVTYKQIVCGVQDKMVRPVVTVISYILYKEWLLASLENKTRASFPKECFIFELKLRQHLYKSCMDVTCLKPLITALEYL